MNRLVEAMTQKAEETLTENGAKAYYTTGSACLDLFAMGGALRNRTPEEILSLWNKAENEDPITAYNILFFIRSIRNGYGERRTFRIIWNSLPKKVQTALFKLVSDVGRFDDLEDSIIHNSQISAWIKENIDYEYGTIDDGQSPSLLAKWLPCGRGNRSAKERTRRMAKALGYPEQEYRKKVVALRKKLNLVESKMAENRWSDIDYSKLPSLAGHKYSKAFLRHDYDGYTDYFKALKEGKATLNASVLTPVDVLNKLSRGDVDEAVAELEWKALPDFMDNQKSLAMIDTSGSMWERIGDTNITALFASSALGIYFAEKNKGPFKDLFMTFSSDPEFVSIAKETTLQGKLDKIKRTDWGRSTDISKAFEAILDLAVKNDCSPEDMPDNLFIFSDMEFDEGCSSEDTIFEEAKKQFESKGYILPRVIFWNLNGKNEVFPIRKNEDKVTLVSGYSIRILSFLKNLDKDPVTNMVEILSSTPFFYSVSTIVAGLYKRG